MREPLFRWGWFQPEPWMFIVAPLIPLVFAVIGILLGMQLTGRLF